MVKTLNTHTHGDLHLGDRNTDQPLNQSGEMPLIGTLESNKSDHAESVDSM